MDLRPRKAYTKPPFSIEKMIDEKLIGRGLNVPDKQQAEHYLTYIGYYRLGAYLKFFQDGSTEPQYKEGATFDDALNLYIFDRELRLVVIDALERIEVASRTVISDTMSLRYGAHWYTDGNLFNSSAEEHQGFVKSIREEIENQRDKCPFLTHYDRTYNSPELPPSWMVAEIMPLGTWSRVFSKPKHQKDYAAIAIKLGHHAVLVQSWLHCLTVLRNFCAHHVCVWNRKFPIRPQPPMVDGAELSDPYRFYAQAAIIQKFLFKISPSSSWPFRLAELFNKHPSVPIGEMGFHPRWSESRFWRGLRAN